MKAAIHLAEHLHEATAHLLVAGWTRRGQPQSQVLFPAIQNAARLSGDRFGCVFNNVPSGFWSRIDELVGLPEDTPSIALIPIGWPKGAYGTRHVAPSIPAFLSTKYPKAWNRKKQETRIALELGDVRSVLSCNRLIRQLDRRSLAIESYK